VRPHREALVPFRQHRWPEGYFRCVSDSIEQRELRIDSGSILRRVEAGESFVVTRNGPPIADLVPHAREQEPAERTLGELQDIFRGLPPVDARRWRADRARADEFLVDDPGDR
jgi:prevent-host-death family protein